MRRHFTSPVIVLAAAVMLSLSAGCDLFKPDVSDASLDDISIAMPRLEKMRADTGRKTVLVDVRSEKNYQAGHLPGALSIPEPTIVADDARLADAYNIVVYGRDDFDDLAVVGTKQFLRHNYAHVFLYRAGLEDWRRNGNRIESPAPATQPQTAPATMP